MATPNVGILTNAGKNLIDQVNAGQTKITFSKIVFSSMDNSQLTDDQVKALTAITPQEVVVDNPEVTLDNNTGETRIRATGNNEALTDGVYVKTYAVYAKDGSGNEILYGITVSPNPNYLPEYDGVTPQAVTYSYKVNISNTSNITFTNSNDVDVSETDLAGALQPYAKTVDVNQQLDKKVTDNKDGSIIVNGKTFVPTDDSKVAHLAGDNNFDKVPTVGTDKSPLLLASSLPSDIARTSQDANFTGKLQKSGQDVAIDSQVVHRNPDTGAVSDSVNFTGPAQKGGIDLATVQDLKSVEDSAWRQLDSSLITLGGVNSSFDTHCLYRIDSVNKRIYISWTIILGQSTVNYNNTASLDFSGIVSRFTNKGTGHMLSQVDEVSPDFFNFNISGSNISFAIPAYANIVLSGYQNDCWFEYDTLLI